MNQMLNLEFMRQLFNSTNDRIVCCNAEVLEKVYKGKLLESFTPATPKSVVQYVGEGVYEGNPVKVYLVDGLYSDKCIILREGLK